VLSPEVSGVIVLAAAARVGEGRPELFAADRLRVDLARLGVTTGNPEVAPLAKLLRQVIEVGVGR
jgi:hypothetical protein